MDKTEALPDDLLADIIGRLSPRDLAVSRCVRKAWRAVVDARRLLLADLLPHSVEGIFINYHKHDRTQFLARPSTAHPGVDYADLHFLPGYTDNMDSVVDHCNGLLLYQHWYWFFVVNPATRRFDRLRMPRNPGDQYGYYSYLVFDPAVSPHYELFVIPSKYLGLFGATDFQRTKLPPEYLTEKNFTVTLKYQQDTSGGVHEDPHQNSMEWPTPLCTMEVFSSVTREWRERSFVREGMPTRRAVNVQCSYDFMYGSRWRRSAYWRGVLYVLHCRGAFFTRLSLSDGTYQVRKTPKGNEGWRAQDLYLGKLEKGVYFAILCGYRLRGWTLSESGGQMDWILKHHVDLEPLSRTPSIYPKGKQKNWILDDDDDDDDDDRTSNFDWNSDDDNVLTIEEGARRDRWFSFLGFHPYKEVVFLELEDFDGFAYHLDSSKVQYLGNLLPKNYHDHIMYCTLDSFIYTPTMISELSEYATDCSISSED